MDWSAGSNMWETQQAVYRARGGPDVIFGVGSFDSGSANLGKCLLITVKGVAKPLLAQVVNTGGDVHAGSFDFQQMGGGVGLCNALAPSGTFPDGSMASDSASPLFAGESIASGTWGPTSMGGFTDVSGCDSLPFHPDGPFSDGGAAMRRAGEKDLRAMCREAFALGLRVNGGVNPSITDLRRVPCPSEIYTMTGAKRTDEPSECTETTPANCSAEPSQNLGILTRMFDGCKPSGGWSGNMPSADPAFQQVVSCGPDGITRVHASHI